MAGGWAFLLGGHALAVRAQNGGIFIAAGCKYVGISGVFLVLYTFYFSKNTTLLQNTTRSTLGI